MPKISDEELIKVLVRLWKKDYDAIQRMATTEVTAAQIIREAVSHFVRAAEDRARRTIDAKEMVGESSLAVDYNAGDPTAIKVAKMFNVEPK